MERVNVERFEKGAEPCFVDKADHIESELQIRDLIRVGYESVTIRVPDVGTFWLESPAESIVNGTFDRQRRSIRQNSPLASEPKAVLAARYRFVVTKKDWIEFVTWDGNVKARISIPEEQPEEAGAMVVEEDPDPELDESVKLKVEIKKAQVLV